MVDILQLGSNLAKTKTKGRGKSRSPVEADTPEVVLTPKALQQRIHELEGQMMQHAQNLSLKKPRKFVTSCISCASCLLRRPDPAGGDAPRVEPGSVTGRRFFVIPRRFPLGLMSA